MPRTAKSIKTKSATSAKASSSRLGKKPPRAVAAKKTQPPKRTGVSKPAKPAPAAKAPKLSVAELRIKVEKLERANALLRSKGREAGRMAKAAASRIAELEEAVSDFEKQEPKKQPPAKSTAPAKRKTRKTGSADPVPADLAEQEPATPDVPTETPEENLPADPDDE